MVKVTIQDISNTEATEDNQVKEESEAANEIQPPPTEAKPQQKLILSKLQKRDAPKHLQVLS